MRQKRRKRQIKHGSYWIIISLKNGVKTGRCTGAKKRQVGSFLNCYDFVYAGRDTVNQVGKIAPNIIKNASNNINQTVKERIDQAIKTGSSEIERIAPKTIRGAIEDVYKTPFRLLGDLWKKTVPENKTTNI